MAEGKQCVRDGCYFRREREDTAVGMRDNDYSGLKLDRLGELKKANEELTNAVRDFIEGRITIRELEIRTLVQSGIEAHRETLKNLAEDPYNIPVEKFNEFLRSEGWVVSEFSDVLNRVTVIIGEEEPFDIFVPNRISLKDYRSLMKNTIRTVTKLLKDDEANVLKAINLCGVPSALKKSGP